MILRLYEWLFWTFPKMVHCLNCLLACVRAKCSKERTDSIQWDHIFPNHRFVIIAIFWMTQSIIWISMLSTWMCVCVQCIQMARAWFQSLSPKKKQKKCLLFLFCYRLLLLLLLLFTVQLRSNHFCGQIKSTIEIEIPIPMCVSTQDI